MIDIKFLRENPEVVKENIRKKFQDAKLPLVDEVIELDKESRATQQEADDLRANRNKISKEIGGLMKEFFLSWISVIHPSSSSPEPSSKVAKSPTIGLIPSFLNTPRALH